MPARDQIENDDDIALTEEAEEIVEESASEELDQERLQQVLAAMQGEQNFQLGTSAGLVAALVGAVIWAVITVATEYQIGWMAVGVGFLVGVAIRKFGRGVSAKFGIAGALLALLGCILGNLFSIFGFIGAQEGISPLSVLFQVDFGIAIELLKATFSPMDLLFYGIAIYEGYHLSFRQITQEELLERYHAASQ
ncbi:MAG: hypothetical protein MPN21_09685 [Thermoanaerobaculia bacterium]|nr:hypothetical protein [Thermoanaerobaculia bacterium]